VVFVVSAYRNNCNLYVGLKDANTGESVLDITTNMGAKLPPHTAHIKNFDENEGIAQFLIENDLGFIMGTFSDSYPEFFFNAFRLPEVDPQGAEEYEKLINERLD